MCADVESKLLTEAGYPISIEEMGERFAGMTWQNILFQVEREASIPISASLLDKSEKLLDMRLEQDVQAIAGVEAALSRLKLKRCICSNSSTARYTGSPRSFQRTYERRSGRSYSDAIRFAALTVTRRGARSRR